MPEKTLRGRLRRAKKEGRPAAIKKSEVKGGSARSRHSIKKSSGLAGMAEPTERHVSRKRAPGKGRSGAKALRTGRAAAYEKREQRAARPKNAKGRTQKLGGSRNVPSGRKKSPSQMNAKRAGGPRKRSRLHGG